MASTISSIVNAAISAGISVDFFGPQPIERVSRVDKRLGLVLPADLKEFLHRFGGGGVSGNWTSGVTEDEGESTTIIGDTEWARREFSLPHAYAVIFKPEDTDEAVWCVYALPDSPDYGKVYAIDTYHDCYPTKLYNSFTDYLADYFKIELES